VVLLAVGVVAYAYMAHLDADELRPIMDTPDGMFVYHHALTRVALFIGVAELVLLAIVAVAAYAMAYVSTRPLHDARERERRFATDAAHELRTPLARIATAAQAARDGDAAEQARALGAIAKMAINASALIGDLLTLARVEHVPSSVSEPIDVAALARDVAASYGTAHPDVQIHVSASDGTFVTGDEARLNRLLANLLDNGVRHARSQVTIEVLERGKRATIVVEDDGLGVDEDQRERIFERFVTTTSGTGLGLPICRWIARAHGGDIRLNGRSRFEVDLPALDVDPD